MFAVMAIGLMMVAGRGGGMLMSFEDVSAMFGTVDEPLVSGEDGLTLTASDGWEELYSMIDGSYLAIGSTFTFIAQNVVLTPGTFTIDQGFGLEMLDNGTTGSFAGTITKGGTVNIYKDGQTVCTLITMYANFELDGSGTEGNPYYGFVNIVNPEMSEVWIEVGSTIYLMFEGSDGSISCSDGDISQQETQDGILFRGALLEIGDVTFTGTISSEDVGLTIHVVEKIVRLEFVSDPIEDGEVAYV